MGHTKCVKVPQYRKIKMPIIRYFKDFIAEPKSEKYFIAELNKNIMKILILPNLRKL